MMFENQLAIFIYDVWYDDDFANVGDLGGFAMKIVDIGKCTIFFKPIITLLSWHRFCQSQQLVLRGHFRR